MTDIRIENLTVVRGSRTCIDDISALLPSGRLIGLIGPNGAGKSSLLRALAGLQAKSGAVLVGTRDIGTFTPHERAREIAFMPQSRDIAWPIAVEDVVALGRIAYRQPFRGLSAADKQTVESAIATFDLQNLRHRKATELSGGEAARVLMARTLAQGTPIILADEPTAGLDPSHQISLMETLSRQAAAGRTILVSLHELGLAARWCDQLLLLDQARIAAFGTPTEVLSAANLSSVYGIEAYIGSDAGGLIVSPTQRAVGA